MKNTFTTNLYLSKRAIYFIIICIFTSLFFNSCKKSDIVEEEIKPVAPKCLITKIAFPNSQYFADFEYNSSGQLISLNNQLDVSDYSTFEYNTKGNCAKISIYKGNTANIQKLYQEWNMVYNSSNVLTEMTEIEGNNKTVHSFISNDKKQITEISNIKMSTFTSTYSTAKFDYNTKGNLIKTTFTEKDNPTKIQEINEYEFDEKNNPFQSLPSIVRYLSFSDTFGYGINNLILRKNIRGGLISNTTIDAQVKYEYNSDNYPTIYTDLNRKFNLVYSYKCQ